MADHQHGGRARERVVDRRHQRRIRLGASVVGAACIAALTTLGGALPAPPLALEPGRLGRWSSALGPAATTMALVRLGALASAAYLVLVVGLAAAGRATGSTALVDLAGRVTAPPARRLVATLVGVGLATSITTSATVAGGRPGAPSPVVAATTPSAADPVPLAGLLHRVAPDRGPLPVMHRLPGSPDLPPSARTWTIAPGDHLWHVAEVTLAAGLGRAPTDAETARYVAAVIEQNRSVLLAPDDPDLVRPGQVFALPPIGGTLSAAGSPLRSPAVDPAP